MGSEEAPAPVAPPAAPPTQPPASAQPKPSRGVARCLVGELLAAASTPGVCVEEGYVAAVVRRTRLADLGVFSREGVFDGGDAGVLRDLAAGVVGRGTTVEGLRVERITGSVAGCTGTSPLRVPTPGSRADQRRLSAAGAAVVSTTSSAPVDPAPQPAAAGLGAGGVRPRRASAQLVTTSDPGLMTRFDTYAAFPGLYGRVDARASALKLQTPAGEVPVTHQARTRGLRPGSPSMRTESAIGGGPPPTYPVHARAQLTPRLVALVLELLGEPRVVLL